MLRILARLVRLAAGRTVSAMGTTGLALGIGLLAFIASQKPWRPAEFWTRVKSSPTLGVGIIFASWILIFLYQAMVIMQGVYLDRQRLLGENGQVVADSVRLKKALDDALRPTAPSKPPIDRETSEERRIKDVQRTVQAAISKAANYPNATTNAAAGWTALGGVISATGPSATATNIVPASGIRFYRVRLAN